MSDEPTPPLTFEDVQEILKILDASSFDELQLDIGGLRLRLRRGAGKSAPAWEDAEPQNSTPSAQHAASSPPAASAAPVPGGLTDIRAPMLGTFYRAPRPGAEPFVDVGTKVDADTTIGIIEVMKLMNAALAGVDGEIREICVENGQLVEYGQVLMRVSPR